MLLKNHCYDEKMHGQRVHADCRCMQMQKSKQKTWHKYEPVPIFGQGKEWELGGNSIWLKTTS